MHMARNNVVDSIISVDGDYIILGARKMHFKVNFDNETFSAYTKEEDMNQKDANLLFACDADLWYLIVGLLRCDYVDRMRNLGYSSLFNKILVNLNTRSAEEAVKVVEEATDLNVPDNYTHDLSKTIKLLKYRSIQIL